jgi:hypothetical protein
MLRQPIARPNNRVVVGIEMLNQLERVEAMFSFAACEVVILPVCIDAETAPIGAKSMGARAIGDRLSASLVRDIDIERASFSGVKAWGAPSRCAVGGASPSSLGSGIGALTVLSAGRAAAPLHRP